MRQSRSSRAAGVRQTLPMLVIKEILDEARRLGVQHFTNLPYQAMFAGLIAGKVKVVIA